MCEWVCREKTSLIGQNQDEQIFKMAANIKFSHVEFNECQFWMCKRMNLRCLPSSELSQNEWVWVRLNLFGVRVRVEWECFWVNLTLIYSFSLNLKMAAILNSAILAQPNFSHWFWLNLMMAAILTFCHLDWLATLVFSQQKSLTSWQNSLPTIGTKKNFTHWFWLNLMMAAILNPAILNLAILDSAILEFFSQTHSHLSKIGSHHLPKKKLHSLILTHFDGWQPSWILPSLHSNFDSFSLNLKMAKHHWILTHPDDGSHLSFSSENHSHLAQIGSQPF